MSLAGMYSSTTTARLRPSPTVRQFAKLAETGVSAMKAQATTQVCACYQRKQNKSELCAGVIVHVWTQGMASTVSSLWPPQPQGRLGQYTCVLLVLSCVRACMHGSRRKQRYKLGQSLHLCFAMPKWRENDSALMRGAAFSSLLRMDCLRSALFFHLIMNLYVRTYWMYTWMHSPTTGWVKFSRYVHEYATPKAPCSSHHKKPRVELRIWLAHALTWIKQGEEFNLCVWSRGAR